MFKLFRLKILFFIVLFYSNSSMSAESTNVLKDYISNINQLVRVIKPMLSSDLTSDKMGYYSVSINKPFKSEIIFTGCKLANEACKTASFVFRIDKSKAINFDIGGWSAQKMFCRIYELQDNLVMQFDLPLGLGLTDILLKRYVSIWIDNALNLITELEGKK